MKRNLLFIALFISIYNFSQVLITTNSSVYNEPDNSSVLQIADNDKGFLMPRIANENVISQPTESLTFYKSSTGKFNFYSGSQWSKIYEQEDAAQLVPRQIQYWNVLEKRRKTRQTSAQKESSRHGIKECASKGRVR